ncbi:hypothetical protein Ndes2437B_g07877 [Nannochloris sp. 'desiccata']
MQSNIDNVFGKAKRRKAAVENEAKHLFNQTARNIKPARSRLFSILKEANVNKKKRQKPGSPSKASAATQPRATANDRAPMQGHNFAHCAAGRPKSTPQTTRSQPSQYVTQTEQQTRRPDVREFKRANRLTGLFSSTAERGVQAEAAWKASESARRFATARIQKEKIREQTERAAKLAEERERVAKELAEKKAALREEELSRGERRRAAAINAQNEQFRKAAAEREAGFVPDTMWPRENWQGVVFGDNYRAYKRSQQKEANEGLNWDERMKRAFNEDRPKVRTDPLEDFMRKCAKERKKARKQSKRTFNEENPDDCWGFKSAPYSTQEDRSDWEWAESPPSGYSSGYGSPPPPPPSSSGAYYDTQDGDDPFLNGDDGESGEEGMGDDCDDSDGYEYGFFQGEEWDNFKRSWHGHSRDHHHDYYYSHHDDTSGGRGAGAGAGAGTARQATVPVAVCQESAARAAQRAVEAARNGAPTSVQGTSNGQNNENFDINARMEEIQTAVISAARHSGNDIAAFASALKIHIDYSKGQEHAKKMAKKGLLMTFHPDKLARAGVLEQYLGQCVTQLILTSVK